MLPYYFDFTPPARKKIEKYYGSPIEEKLNFPIRMTGLKTIKPLYADPAEFGETAEDEFGVVWSTLLGVLDKEPLYRGIIRELLQ